MRLEPGQICGRRGGGHGLLDELDAAVGGEPFDLFEGAFFGLPAFVGVHAHRFFWGGFAQGGEVGVVIARADFQLQNGIGFRGEDFLANDVVFVDADAEGSDVMIFLEAEAEEIVEGLTGLAGGAVEEGDIEGGFGGELSGREVFHVGHAGVEVVEGKPTCINLREKFESAGNIFMVTAGGGGFAEASGSVVVGELKNGDGEMADAAHVAGVLAQPAIPL